MRWQIVGALLIGVSIPVVGLAQLPSYGMGRTPTPDEIKAQDITVGHAGKELPPGKGTAKEGAAIFEKRCAHCHGVNGMSEGQFPALSGKKTRIVNYPFATIVWDFINSAMPRKVPDIGSREGTLTPDEVYSLTAFILYRNNIVGENDVLNATNLPKVKMPKRDPLLDKVAPQ